MLEQQAVSTLTAGPLRSRIENIRYMNSDFVLTVIKSKKIWISYRDELRTYLKTEYPFENFETVVLYERLVIGNHDI